MFQSILDRPRWALALDVFRQYQVGDTVPYEALEVAVGSSDRKVVQDAARAAGKRLLVEDLQAIEAVPNQGYRIVQPEEHIRLSRSQGRRSAKALLKGRDVAVFTDLNGMSEEGQAIVLATARGFDRMLDMQRATNRGLAALGRAQAALERQVDEGLSASNNRLERLEAQVERLLGEEKTDGPATPE